MSTIALSIFWIHTVSVQTFLGASPTGDTYAAPVGCRGFLDDGVVRVQGATGEQLVQKSIWYGPLSDAPLFVLESRLVVNGRPCQVTAIRRRDGGILGLPDHIEVEFS
jgi:hypothetical protein